MGSRNFRDLIVWQKSMELVVSVYGLTEQFPKSELFGLTQQMRRASVSIPSNIAEGSKRSTQKDFLNFILIAAGSGGELETQLELAERLSFGKKDSRQGTQGLLDEVMRMLNRFSISLRSKN